MVAGGDMGDVHSWANVGIGALVLICAATGVAVAARAPRAVAGCADVAQAPLNVLPSSQVANPTARIETLCETGYSSTEDAASACNLETKS